jgi:hypothetical protein
LHQQRTDYRLGHGEANRRLTAPGTNKRGRGIHPRCQLSWLGYQDSNLD